QEPGNKERVVVLTLVFSPNQRYLAVGGEQDSISLLEVAKMDRGNIGRSISASVHLDGNLQGTKARGVWTIAFDKTSTSVASGSRDGYVRLWNLPPTLNGSPSTLQAQTLWQGFNSGVQEGQSNNYSHDIRSIAFSSSGKFVAAGCVDSMI